MVLPHAGRELSATRPTYPAEARAERPGRRTILHTVQESPLTTPRDGVREDARTRLSEAEIRGGFLTGVDAESAPIDAGRPPVVPSPIPFAPLALNSDLGSKRHDPKGAAAAALLRKEQLYRLPAIATPRRNENGHATIEDGDEGRNVPNNPVQRRYFFDEEKPLAFLRHFDVRVSARERPEKLLGGRVLDTDPAVMRHYYCDFLYLPEFQPPFEKGDTVVELTALKAYIESVTPRNRLDVYPLYILLKGVLRHVVDKETIIVSARERALQNQVQELLDEKSWLAKRHSEERKLMDGRLEALAHQLAEAEQRLRREEDERDKLKASIHDLELVAAGATQLAEEAERAKGDMEQLVRGLGVSDRVKLLNVLASQTAVISQLDRQTYASCASLEAQDSLLITVLTKMAGTESVDYRNFLKLLARIFGMNTHVMLEKMLEDFITVNGAGDGALLTTEAFGSSEERKQALLRAVLTMYQTAGYDTDDKELLSSFGLGFLAEIYSRQQRDMSRTPSLEREGNKAGGSNPKNTPRGGTSAGAGGEENPSLPDPLKRRDSMGVSGNLSRDNSTSRSRESSSEDRTSAANARGRKSSDVRGPDALGRGLQPRTRRDSQDSNALARSLSSGGFKHVDTQTDAVGTSDSEVQTEPVAILDANASGDEFASMIDNFGLRENLQRQMIQWKRPKKADLLAHWLGIPPDANAAQIRKATKCGAGSLPAALKHIATLFQNKMDSDKEHDAQQKPRQGFPEFVRDSFTQQFGLQSVAKTKMTELVHFCQSEVEKGRAAATSRVLLLHRFFGLRQPQGGTLERQKEEEEEDEIENSVEGVSFLLLLVQELFPSWRYGAAFLKEFAEKSISMPLENVEFALERVFASKRYGGEVPQALLQNLQESANDVQLTQRKQVKTKASRPKSMISDDTRMVDVDYVLLCCHDEFLSMEHACVEAVLNLYEEVDDNGDGVLQFDEFSNLLSRIDQTLDSEQIAEMYYECVGDDDVIDRDELLQIVVSKGLLFNLKMG